MLRAMILPIDGLVFQKTYCFQEWALWYTKCQLFFKMFFPMITSGIVGLGFRVLFYFMEKNKIK
jgi:hypothetical protein